MYSAAVRRGGAVDGQPIGVLGLVFRWDALAQTIVEQTPLREHEREQTRVMIMQNDGRILADTSKDAIFSRFEWQQRRELFGLSKGYLLGDYDEKPCCVAHAMSQGFETYSSGWRSVILQSLTQT